MVSTNIFLILGKIFLICILLSLNWFMIFVWTYFLSGIYLLAYRYFYPRKQESLYDYWHPARKFLARIWNTWGKYYDYEVVNYERIPSEGPALLIYYHGLTAIDLHFLTAKTFTEKKRMICSVVDKGFNLLAVSRSLLEGQGMYISTVEECCRILNEGNLLTIAPGGTREAFFAGNSYSLMWNQRIGFAKLALKAKVPVIPYFTKNIREIGWIPGFLHPCLLPIYEKNRVPFTLMFAGFPVKLTTFIGEPIPYDSNLTPEELSEKVAEGLRTLIKEHQPLPGSYVRAMWERFQSLFRKKIHQD